MRVPVLDPDLDSLSLALALAAAGFYVLPTAADNPRHAGSVLGKGWPERSSTDPAQIAAWFAGSTHRVAIHCGRSGLTVLDVDHWDGLTEVVHKAVTGEGAPFQATRLDGPDADPQRGHYLFATPPGRRLTNSNGELGKAWGEVRGNNGIVLVGGPGREFLVTGEVPVLPDYVATLLPDGGDRTSTVSDAEVARFVAGYVGESNPARLVEVLAGFTRSAREGSRHQAMVSTSCWAVREIVKGRLSARPTLRRLADEFANAMAHAPRAGDRVLVRAAAESEARTVIGWAVAQEWTPAGPRNAVLDPAARLSKVGSTQPAAQPAASRLRNLGDAVSAPAPAPTRTDPAPDPQPQVSPGAGLPVDDVDPALLAMAAADEDRFEWQLRERRVRQRVDDHLAGERRRPLARMDAAAFLAAPMPTYLVPKMLYRDSLAVCFGPPGAAKTFFVLDLALCLSSGTPWRSTPTDVGAILPRTKVHYLMAEGQAVNVGRTWAWLTRHKVDPGALDGWFTAYTEPVELTVEGIAQYLGDVAVDRPGLIVLDTKHAMMAGDESKAQDVKVMRDALDAIRRVCGSTVLLVDHTGLSDLDRVRGSGSQKAMVATEIRVVDDNGVRTASMTRNTADAVEGAWSFELVAVADAPRAEGAGVPVVPVPVDPRRTPFGPLGDTWYAAEQPALPDDVSAYNGKGQAAVRPLARFMRHSATTGIGHTMAEARRALWAVLRDEKGKPSHSEDTVTRAWGALVDMGRLVVVEGGQSTSRSKWLPRSGDPAWVDLDSAPPAASQPAPQDAVPALETDG